MIKNPNDKLNITNPDDLEDEDEMVIADMSYVQKPSVFLPKRIRHEDRLPGSPLADNSNPYATPGLDLSPEETKWAILGSLKAALLIGGAYAIGLGGLVLLMYLAFKYLA